MGILSLHRTIKKKAMPTQRKQEWKSLIGYILKNWVILSIQEEIIY